MTQEEWGPWIEHDGMGMPDQVRGMYIAIIGKTLEGEERTSEGLVPLEVPCHARICWQGGGWFSEVHYAIPIIRYRIRKPRGLTILQRIAEQPQKERVEA